MPVDVMNVVVSALVGGGSALTGFQIFGAKWMEHRFADRLEASKQTLQRQLEQSRQDHATDTERLKYRVAGLLDRATKLNQREFEVLPDVWAALDEAYHWTHDLLSPWRTSPDFSRMSEKQFEEVLAGSKLKDWQKEEIRDKTPFDRSSYFFDAMAWYEIQETKKAVHKLSSSLSKSGIYINPETYAKLSEFTKLVQEAVRLYEIEKKYPDGHTEKIDGPVETFRTEGTGRFDALSSYLRERYWETPSLA